MLSALVQEMPVFFAVCAGIFGAIIGSFIGCAAYRVPRHISLRNPPHSYCPHCHKRLRLIDLIPLISYLIWRGRCRQCHAPISSRYFMIEFMSVFLTLGLWTFFAPHPFVFIAIIICWCSLYFVFTRRL